MLSARAWFQSGLSISYLPTICLFGGWEESEVPRGEIRASGWWGETHGGSGQPVIWQLVKCRFRWTECLGDFSFPRRWVSISKASTAQYPGLLSWLQFQSSPLPTRTSPWSQLYLDPPSRPGGHLSHLVHHDQAGHSPRGHTWPGCRHWALFSQNRSSFLFPVTSGAEWAGSAWRREEAWPRQMDMKKKDTFSILEHGWVLSTAPRGQGRHISHLLSPSVGSGAAGSPKQSRTSGHTAWSGRAWLPSWNLSMGHSSIYLFSDVPFCPF